MSKPTNKIAPPIDRLTVDQQQPYGVYRGLVASTDTTTWDGNKNWWSPRRWKRKNWIFFGAYTSELAIGFAMIDAGYLAKAFCYVYQRSNKQYWEQEYTRPFGFNKNFEGSLKEYWQLGAYQIKTQQDQWLLSYHHKNIQLELQFKEPHQGIGAVCPSDEKRPFHYTYKNLLLPTQIYYKNGAVEHQTTQALGSLDYSKGYPPRHTCWNWTSFIGQLEDGTPLGINTVNGFNGDLENALWLGNQVECLGAMNYQCATPPLKEAWKMQAQNGQLELSLHPDGLRKEQINLGLLKSNFKQVFGTINGRLFHQKTWKNFQGYGLMEDHEALW